MVRVVTTRPSGLDLFLLNTVVCLCAVCDVCLCAVSSHVFAACGGGQARGAGRASPGGPAGQPGAAGCGAPWQLAGCVGGRVAHTPAGWALNSIISHELYAMIWACAGLDLMADFSCCCSRATFMYAVVVCHACRRSVSKPVLADAACMPDAWTTVPACSMCHITCRSARSRMPPPQSHIHPTP